MTDTYWHKQVADKPLFTDLQWSRPENKRFAGKLLIIGGDSSSFSVPAESYGSAEKAGIGTARIVLPDHVRQLVPAPFKLMAEYAPSIKHGSFAKAALGELVEHAKWPDTVLLAGGFGKNSETMALVERFTQVFSGQLVVSGDAVHAFIHSPNTLLDRPNTLLVSTLSDLQKIAASKHILITHSQQVAQLVEKLHELSQVSPVHFITSQQETLIVSTGGRVSTTPITGQVWRLHTSAKAAVWWTQFPDQPFEALSTSMVT